MVTKRSETVITSRIHRKAPSSSRGRGKAHREAAIAPRGRANAGPAASHRGLSLVVLGQFRLIFRSVKKHFQWVQERTGVSGAQLWVLAELHRTPGIRVTELARAMAVHQSTASNLIDRLEKAGLIHRERSDADQRVVRLSLTASGRRIIAAAPLPLEGVLPDALNALPHKSLSELQRRLEELAKSMKVRDSKGKRIPLAEM